jgi:hypothetical protein
MDRHDDLKDTVAKEIQKKLSMQIVQRLVVLVS